MSVFARQKTRIRGTFASNQALLTMSGNNNESTQLGIVQGLQLQFARQFNNIYSLTAAAGNTTSGPEREVDAYRIGGRAQGQGQLSRILGPERAALSQFYADMGNECNYKQLIFSLGAGACTPGSTGNVSSEVKYTVMHTAMTAVSINVNSNDVLVNEGVQLVFADLEVQN